MKNIAYINKICNINCYNIISYYRELNGMQRLKGSKYEYRIYLNILNNSLFIEKIINKVSMECLMFQFSRLVFMEL